MESEVVHPEIPCSSIAVESTIRVGAAGAIWGLCSAPYDATNKGLTGIPRASFVAKSVGVTGLQCGFLAGIFTMTRCSIQQYRQKDDWVNSCIAGAVAGAAIAARTRSWKNVAEVADCVTILETILHFQDPLFCRDDPTLELGKLIEDCRTSAARNPRWRFHATRREANILADEIARVCRVEKKAWDNPIACPSFIKSSWVCI